MWDHRLFSFFLSFRLVFALRGEVTSQVKSSQVVYFLHPSFVRLVLVFRVEVIHSVC